MFGQKKVVILIFPCGKGGLNGGLRLGLYRWAARQYRLATQIGRTFR